MNEDLIKWLNEVAEERQKPGTDGSAPFAYPRHRDLCREAATALTEAASRIKELEEGLEESATALRMIQALCAGKGFLATVKAISDVLDDFSARQLIQTGDEG